MQFSGSGRLRNQPFTIEGAAASVLALEHQERPYALNVSARAGATSARFEGTIVPAKVDNVDGLLTVQGRDPEEIKRSLLEKGINVTTPQIVAARLDMEARGLKSLVRASVHYYNTENEIERFCAALKT